MKTNNLSGGQHAMLSVPFMLMAIIFNVCLIASNLFETKLFMAGPVALTGGVIIFPVSYIINDCLVEVWGYRKARLVIWTGFAMNFFVVAMAQIVRLLPAAPFWDGGPHFDYIFAMAPRVTLASLLAFLSGSTVNAWIMSRMKVASKGKRFSVRAIVSSIGGETVDSIIFFPIAFWGIGITEMLTLMATQIVLKTLYEVIILPVTNIVVKKVKEYEGTDTFDENISYNPFRISDI
ncbi:MAG: queuosine precursor transporter [Bacteroidales bacterium]|nr:queuosine precursor transporter [Bacteroidales bacterium]